MSELKCCPFCSGEPQIETYDCKYSVKEYWIYCCSCDCASSRYYSKEDAIEQWNTRKPMDNIVEKLEENSFDMSLENPDCKAIWTDKAINIVKQEINNGLE